MDLKGFRQQYPQYDNISDDALSQRLHQKYYSHVSYEQFIGKFNPVPLLEQQQTSTAVMEPPAPQDDLLAAARIAMSDQPIDEETIPSEVVGKIPIGGQRDTWPGGAQILSDEGMLTFGELGTAIKAVAAEQLQDPDIGAEFYNRLRWTRDYMFSLGGMIGPKGLKEELDAEAEGFSGFGSATMPVAGKTAKLAFEWGYLYPTMFKAVGIGGEAISSIPKVKKAQDVIKAIGGISNFAKAHPELYRAGLNLVKAFGKGEAVGQFMGAAESIGKDKSYGEWVGDMNKRGAAMGAIAGTFSLAHSYDQYKYIKDLRIYLNQTVFKNHQTRMRRYGMSPKASARIGEQEAKKVEDLIWYTEQEMALGERTLLGGKKPKLSAKEAAELFAKEGYVVGRGGKFVKGHKQLREIRKPKPKETLKGVTPRKEGPLYGKRTVTVTDADGTKRKIRLPVGEPRITARKPVVGKPAQDIQVVRSETGRAEAYFDANAKLSELPKGWTVAAEKIKLPVPPAKATPGVPGAAGYAAEQVDRPAKALVDILKKQGVAEKPTPLQEIEAARKPVEPAREAPVKPPVAKVAPEGIKVPPKAVQAVTEGKVADLSKRVDVAFKQNDLDAMQAIVQESWELPETPEAKALVRRIQILDGEMVARERKRLAQAPPAAEKKVEVTRHFQKYTPEQKTDRAASRKLGHRAREKIGEYFYSTNVIPDRAFDTAKEAREAAEAILQAPPVEKAEVKKEVYTSTPADWRAEKTLVDWGQKGIRTQGNRALSAGLEGKKTRKTFIWKQDLTELPTRLPKSTMDAFKARTDEVWQLQRRGKGRENVWLVPKKLNEQLRKELGPEAFVRKPYPEMRTAWTTATKGKGLFGEVIIKPTRGGAAGGSYPAVAVATGRQGGYGTIEASEKPPIEKTQPHRVDQIMPEKDKLSLLDELLKIASPGHRGGARAAARVMRKNLGRLAHESVAAQEVLRKAHRAFTWMNRKDIYEFIDRMETGQGQPTAKLEAISRKFRELLDGRRVAVQQLGKGNLEKFYENYFPHLWKDPKTVGKTIRQIFGSRRLQGSKAFLKKRTIMTVKEGRELGYELVSENPVDLVLLKLFEMDKYLMAHRLVRDFRTRNMVRFIYSRSRGPEGWEKFNDPVFTIYMPPEITKKEGYDSAMVNQLMDFAESIGVDAQRFVSIRGRRFGYAQLDIIDPKASKKVRTRYATPSSVLAHEIGHIVGFRYNMYEVLGRRREGGQKEFIRGKHKGERRFVPSKDAVEYRRTIDKEWRALADARARDIKNVTPGFRSYLRGKREKEAVMFEAHVHAPSEFERVAPTLYRVFKKFINNHSDLRPFLDIKPSLVLGVSEAKIKVPGFTVLGYWYAPEPIAKIVNNYLSPGLRNSNNVLIGTGYNMTRRLWNVLNQAQLSLSGFHGLNILFDLMGSGYGLGLRKTQIPGQRLAGLAELVVAPVSVVPRLWNGVRIRKAYKQQLNTIENPKLRQVVQAVILANGSDRLDPFYYNQSIKALKTTISDLLKGGPKQKIKGVFKLPFNIFGSTLELLAKPLMEWYVPTAKLGLFAKMAQSEMKRVERGLITTDQLHERLVSSWDSVDNRMGQLRYDNLFWNKTLKDSLMLAIRSVGWNLGSWREFGGIPVDIFTTKGRIERGDVWLSHKMGYGIGVVVFYAVACAVINYLLTGEPPTELRDYFYPRTGEKNPDGSDERLTLPIYAKDWFAWSMRPGQTIKNKRHPGWSLIYDLARNKNFFNTEIRHPSDPISKQLLDFHSYIAREFLPLSVRNYIKMSRTQPERGSKNVWVSITGISSAPAYITRTPAQKLMYRYIIENIPQRTKTQVQQELYWYRKDIKNRLRKGEPINKVEAVMKIGQQSFNRLVKDAQKEPFAEAFNRLSLYQALNVYTIANRNEKLMVYRLLRGKYSRAKKITPDMKVQYNELMR